MNKLSKENLNKIIDYTVLSLIGAFTCCYSFFWSHFAEINIQLSFFNFPIFIGEILLAFCIIMLLFKWRVSLIRLNGWHYLLFAYISFVVGKAFYGYCQWGPLALRNAALFYYPIFAIVGYYFYNSDFFKNRFIRYSVLSILITTVFFREGYKTYYFTYFMLILMLFMEMKCRRWKYILILLFIAICYNNLLITFVAGRNVLVSSLLGYAFISVISVCYFLRLSPRLKKIILLFVFIFLAAAFWYISGSKAAAKSLVDIKTVFNSYRDHSKLIKEKAKYFSFSDPKVKLYQKNAVYRSVILTREKTQPESITQTQGGPGLLSQSQPKTEPQLQILHENNAKRIIANMNQDELLGMVQSGVRKHVISSNKEGQFEFVFKDKISSNARRRIDKEELVEFIVEKYDISPYLEDLRMKSATSVYLGNILYRLFLWQDMFEELAEERKVFGADFGKPFRSKRLELARFDEGWKTRVGWVEPHNSYVHMIYRAGIIGLLFIIALWFVFFKIVVVSVRIRSLKGVFLASILLYWISVSNFMVILELPHWAIPFWSLFGMSLRYCHNLRHR